MGQSTLDAQGNPGVFPGKVGDGFNRKGYYGQCSRHANVALQFSAGIAHRRAQAFQGFECRNRPAKQFLAFLCYAQGFFVPVKKHGLKLFFQAAQLVADRGRIAVHKLSRLAHAACSGDKIESAQPLQKIAVQFLDHGRRLPVFDEMQQ